MERAYLWTYGPMLFAEGVAGLVDVRIGHVSEWSQTQSRIGLHWSGRVGGRLGIVNAVRVTV